MLFRRSQAATSNPGQSTEGANSSAGASSTVETKQQETHEARAPAPDPRQEKPLDREALQAQSPGKCCEGGNCAECGDKQPPIINSPEFPVALEGLLKDGGLDAFFTGLGTDSGLKPSAELVAVVTNGDGSIQEVGTLRNFEPMRESPSAVEYRNAITHGTTTVHQNAYPSAQNPTPAPQAAQPLVHINTSSQTYGASHTTFAATAATTSTIQRQAASVSRDYVASVNVNNTKESRETAASPAEKRAPSEAVQARESSVEKPRESAPTARATEQKATESQTREARPNPTPQQETTTTAHQRTFSPQSNSSSNYRPRSTTSSIPSPSHPTRRQVTTATPHKLFHGVIQDARPTRGTTSVRAPSAPRLPVSAQIDQLLKRVSSAPLTSSSHRQAIAILRAAAIVLQKGSDRAVAPLTASRRGDVRVDLHTRAKRSTMLASGRFAIMREKIERLRAKYGLRSKAIERSQRTKGPVAEKAIRLGRRALVANRNQERRAGSRSKARELRSISKATTLGRKLRHEATLRTRSARLRGPRTRSSKNSEIRALRREVRSLKKTLQDLLPMMEMMTKARGGRGRSLVEDDLDIRGVTSERELRSLLRKKKLSTRDLEKIEKEITKRKTKNGTARKARITVAANKKKGSTKSEGAAENEPKDAEQKTFDKTLSTFRMRTEDPSDNEDRDCTQSYAE